MISANSEIVWESLMTYYILDRNLDVYQVIAVCFVLAGIILSLYDPKSHTFGEPDSSLDRAEVIQGICLTTFSRFLSSLNTILAER